MNQPLQRRYHDRPIERIHSNPGDMPPPNVRHALVRHAELLSSNPGLHVVQDDVAR